MEVFIPHDVRAEKIWLDGEIISGSKSTTHIFNNSLHYANAVIEGLRIYNGNVFMLAPHTQRLLDGTRAYKFPPLPYSAEQIDQACIDVAAANNLTEGYIRPIAYLGSEDIAVPARRCTVHLAIGALPLASVLNGPQRLITPTLRRASARCVLVHTKSAPMFAASRLAKLEALEAGFDEVMFLDEEDYIADSSVANVFFVMDGKIHTPQPDNILPGITQKVICKLAELRGYEVVIRKIKPDELDKATEAFLCGTAAEIHEIIQIDNRTFPKGEITTALIADYHELVRKTPAEVDAILGTSGGIGL